MFDRLGEYLSRAVALRPLAKRTAYPEVEDQLLVLAAAFRLPKPPGLRLMGA
jgi:hypothetical protein